jgi:hypothetical protein
MHFKYRSHIICVWGYTLGWVDIGTGTKVPLRFVAYLSKVTKKVF